MPDFVSIEKGLGPRVALLWCGSIEAMASMRCRPKQHASLLLQPAVSRMMAIRQPLS